jgi:hypothetical protein
MSFRDWQPLYAAHGIAMFPVVIGPDGKKPLVSNYARLDYARVLKSAKSFPTPPPSASWQASTAV